MKIRVAINGYGTIGKRVADAVSLQDDMEVAGVVKTRPSFEARVANQKKFPLYANTKENVKAFEDASISVEGSVESLLEDCDIVVDCTPGKMGALNKENLYIPMKVKAIFQGGEKPNISEASFNASSNFMKSHGKDYVRVVSCNTTGLCRTLGAIDRNFGLDSVRAVMVRRGPDPSDAKKGPVNAIVPNPVTIPSHHGPDVNTIFPDMNIMTTAIVVPTTLMHLHTLNAKLRDGAETEQIVKLLERTPRVMLFDAADGIDSTAKIMENARDMGRMRSDLNEIAVWRESINVVGKNELFYVQAIHQESDVVPENVDCIRAMMQLTDSASESMKKTDSALGLKKWW